MTLSLKRIRLVAWGVVVLALAVMVWFGVLAPKLDRSVQDTLGQGDYRLETTTGVVFTPASLRGGPSAVFFGYAHCPDVCPTTLGDIETWRAGIGAPAQALRVFFVTVDPERDTRESLSGYLSWAEGITGVTGPRPEIDKALKAFRIFARRGEGTDDSYTMDHTAYMMLFDAEGRFTQTISYQEPLDTALPKLRALLGAG